MWCKESNRILAVVEGNNRNVVVVVGKNRNVACC